MKYLISLVCCLLLVLAGFLIFSSAPTDTDNIEGEEFLENLEELPEENYYSEAPAMITGDTLLDNNMAAPLLDPVEEPLSE